MKKYILFILLLYSVCVQSQNDYDTLNIRNLKETANTDLVLLSEICIDSIGKPCNFIVINGIPVNKNTVMDKNNIKKMIILEDVSDKPMLHGPQTPVLLVTTKNAKIKKVKKNKNKSPNFR